MGASCSSTCDKCDGFIEHYEDTYCCLCIARLEEQVEELNGQVIELAEKTRSLKKQLAELVLIECGALTHLSKWESIRLHEWNEIVKNAKLEDE